MTQVKRFSEYAREIVREYGQRARDEHLSFGVYEGNNYQITIDHQSLIVRDKKQQKNILFTSNNPHLNRSQFDSETISNFTAIDFDLFEKQHRKIEKLQQQRLIRQYQLEEQQRQQRQNQLEL